MAIPHEVQKQLIKKRLSLKEGKAKLEEIKLIQLELPGYNTGPYGELKKWLNEEARKTIVKSKAKFQDSINVKRQGERQFVLVGLPSVGKSSLISELTGLQTKVAAYEFTTLKAIPGVMNLNGAYVQIIDLPGLISGASEDVGGGKRFVGMIKNSDGIILVCDLSKPLENLDKILHELEISNIDKPFIVVGTKVDLKDSRENLEKLRQKFSNHSVIGISSITKEGFDLLKEEIWKLTNLMKIFPKNKDEPMILEKGDSIKEFTSKIHKSFLEKFKTAKVTGKSAKFPNQQVGLNHKLEDGDIVEIILKR